MNLYSTGFAITLLLCSDIVKVHGDCFKLTKFNSKVRSCEKITDHAQCIKYSNWGVFETEEDCCDRLVDGCSSCSEGREGSRCIVARVIDPCDQYIADHADYTFVTADVEQDCNSACSAEGLVCDNVSPENQSQGMCQFKAAGHGDLCASIIRPGGVNFNPSFNQVGCFWKNTEAAESSERVCSRTSVGSNDYKRICACKEE